MNEMKRFGKLHIRTITGLLLVMLCMLITISVDAEDLKRKKKKKKKKKKTEQVDQDRTNPGLALADAHFNNFEFFQAAQEYKKVVDAEPNNKYANYMLAESYREFFDYENAEKYYKKVVDIGLKEYPKARYWYAFMLMDNGHYEKAKAQFKQFITEYTGTDLQSETDRETARQAIENCDFAIAELKKPLRDFNFHVLPEPINTESSDYSPVIGSNDSMLIITSAREESTGGETYSVLGGTYSDNFRFQLVNGEWLKMGDEDGFSTTNSTFNESSGSFNGDHSKFYFTRCDEKFKVGKYENYNCAVYVSKFKDGKWNTPVRLNENINLPGQWNAQPTISPDGNLLFFVSKRPGGIGMHDIWYSINNGGEDNWGPAVNMGPTVNTLFVDMSPRYYGDQKILFFSSNGHAGFGGLDIFMTNEEEEFAEVKNVGLPFNSHRDDFFFVLGEKSGYISSNREGGIGNDDIYFFDIDSKESLIAIINKDSLGDANSITVEGKMLYEGTKQPAVNETVYLTDKDGNVIKTTTTNQDGYYRFDNLPADNYKVILKNPSALTDRGKFVSDTVAISKSDKMPSKTIFENIYFDFDMYSLRPEGKKVLDELAVYVKQHPEVQIELNANTDSIGSYDYNKRLSELRGRTAENYLYSKGVDKSKLVVNAQSYEKPLASNSNQIGRQLNRRVEFYILGGPGYKPQAMTYIVEPGARSIQDVASKFNMSVDEIRALNGLETDSLIPYRPLRVRRIGDNDLIAPVTKAEAGKPDKRNKKYYAELTSRTNAYESGVDQHNQQREIEYTQYKERYHTAQAAKSKVLRRQLQPGEDVYVVQKQNTLYRVAKLYGMTVKELKQLNEIKNDTIYVEQKLIVRYPTQDPGPDFHIVKKGETLETIAAQYKISVQDLNRWNHFEGYILQQNMLLRIREEK